MTWASVNDESQQRIETLVTLEFFERGEETEILLAHTRFADIATRDRHEQRWSGGFVKLAALPENA